MKIDNVKSLYGQIDNKTDFIKKAAENFNKRPNTLRVHWFSNTGFWSVPKDLEDKVIAFMQKYIQIQNGLKQE